jgi:SAM-dependent methyltransferase
MRNTSRQVRLTEDEVCNLVNMMLTKLVINRLPSSALGETRFPAFVASIVAGLTGLDLGCGIGSHLPFNSLKWFGIDIHMPSLLNSNARPEYRGFICADLLHVDKVLQPKCVDTVIALDLIEHFNKRDAAELLTKMEALARRRVVVFTPNGYLEQDGRAVSSNPWMEHRSGWTVAEMQGLGYDVIGWSGWRGFAGPHAYIWRRLRPLFLILSLVSQPFVERRAPIAFHLLCWKTLAAQGS